MSLHAYDGAALHAGERGQSHTTYQCCSDHSGLIEYRFNSLGYRGAEFAPEAEVVVFVVGCSHAFGVGVAEELTWPNVFCRVFAEHYGIPAAGLNLQNFSQGAASNDYIARVILTQCARVKPALVIGAFTHNNRVEYLDDRTVCNIGPWRVKDPKDRIGTPTVELADAFYDYYSDDLGCINAIKNILLVQEFLKSREIPYLISWIGGGILGHAEHISSPVIGRLLELVDRTRICPASIEHDDVFVDLAADLAHPGPESHARFAERMLTTCRAAYPLEHFRPEAVTDKEAAHRPREHHVALSTRTGHGVDAPSLLPVGFHDDAGKDTTGRQWRQSRWQRLREKIRRMKKEDPNIYPLY